MILLFSGMDNNYCCVPQCYSHGVKIPRTSFHRFPSINERRGIRRLQWITKLRIGKEVSDRMVVCGKHFKESDFFPATAGVNGLKRRVLKRNAIPSCNLPTSTEYDDETKAHVRLQKTKRSMSNDKIPVNKRMNSEGRNLLCLDETSSIEPIKDQEDVTNKTSSSYVDEIPERNTVTSPFITRLSVMTPNNSAINANTTEQNSDNLEKSSQNCRLPLLPVKYKENSEFDCSKYNSSPDDSKETLTQKLEAMLSINARLQKQIKFYQSRCQMYEKEVNIMKGVIDNLQQINSVTFDI